MKLSEIVQAAAEERQAKKRYPRPLKETGGTLRWLCCSEPFKDQTRKGETVWMATCMWKKGPKSGSMKRILAKPAKDPDNPDAPPMLGPKPTEVILGGKRVKRC